MTEASLLWAIAAGGAVGALLRTSLYRWVDVALHDGGHGLSRFGRTRATLLANLIGCFGLGVLAGGAPAMPEPVAVFLSIGVCGSISTFSTLIADHFRLARSRGQGTGWIYLAASVTLGFGAFWLGAQLFASAA